MMSQSGIQAGLTWVILQQHLTLTEVSWWHSSSDYAVWRIKDGFSPIPGVLTEEPRRLAQLFLSPEPWGIMTSPQGLSSN